MKPNTKEDAMNKKVMIILLFIILTATTFGQPANYRGICVGINDYPGSSNDLLYAVRDAQHLKYRLRDHQNWTDGNIELILDGFATK